MKAPHPVIKQSYQESRAERDERQKYVGRKVISADGKSTGIVTKIGIRWCYLCQSNRAVYSVKWDTKHYTFPCPSGCTELEDGTLKIN